MDFKNFNIKRSLFKMPLLNPRKMRKLRNNPKLFFQDAIKKRTIPLANALKKYRPKKYRGYSKYVIVSAVYNVEKYLDDYFKSIIHQRLDFKNNLHIICIDDGSTDSSAEIIKNYQKKYPKNITYLYKENGGQASARNLGLKYLQENENLKDKFTWVTFTDPDDFLDIDYFYEVDRFLEDNQDEDICMVSANMIYYYEANNIFKDTHPLRFKFEREKLLHNFNLNQHIQGSIGSTFLMITRLKFEFDELLKPNFEDAKLINFYLLENLRSKSVFLPKAIYFYRRRELENSTSQRSIYSSDLYLLTNRCGTLELLKRNNIDFIQNISLYHFMWQLRDIVNSPNIDLSRFMDISAQQQYLSLLDENFSFIDTILILNYNLAGCWFFHKVGILNCFKGEYPPFQITYIEDFDCTKRQILLRYFTPDNRDIESIRIDGKEVYADYEKIVQHDFLTRVFTYEKRLWIHIPKDSKKLEVFIRGQRARITFGGKQHQSLEVKQFENKFHKISNSAWFFADRDYEADDNAEHLYRYIMQNHSHQKIYFALRKDCKDWKRLQNEGFNLIEWGSGKFEEVLKKANKVISSHLDAALMSYVKKYNRDFIFLEHGETIASNCATWFNQNKIKLITLSCELEHKNIATNYNNYHLTPKEAKITGFARYDSLIKNNLFNNKQVFIMPTWRKNLVGQPIPGTGIREYNKEFLDSEYLLKWKSFLNSKKLEELALRYGYRINFFPHFQIRQYLEHFEIPKYICINFRENGESLQRVFQESDLMITDYTSAAFSMAFLKKPVLYYQFDEKDNIKGLHHKREKNFNYRTDGFGPVVTTEEDLLKELEILLQNDCKVGEPYKSNIENTFAFRDGKCCERIYQEILKLDEPYENQISLEYIEQKAQDAINHECYQEAMWRYEYLLENSKSFDEKFALRYLESAMKIDKGYDAAQMILDKGVEKELSNQFNLLIIKNILSNKKAPKEEIEKCLNILESLKIPQEKEKEFLLSKLRIYFYLADRTRVNEIIEELQTKYNISKEDIHFEILFASNTISIWGGGGNN